MAFKPGDPKPPGSGRKKGTKNKASIPKAVEVMASMGFNPTRYLIDLASKQDLADDLKVKIGLELQGYVQPKAKEGQPDADETSDSNEPTEIPSEELAELINLSR